MDKEYLVSVVIPVYKVEKYLPYCFESIKKQTFENYEIVLVDDGSPDKCGKICDDFATLFDNVKVIHQKNQGLSAARNNGAKMSSGKYITFLDSDDVVSKDYIETLYTLVIENEADISVGLLVPFWGEESAEIKRNCSNKLEIFDTEKALEEMMYGQKFGVQGPDKLYKRDLVVNDPFPIGKLHEDQAAMYKIIANCKKLAYTNKPIYFYRQRNESIVHTRVTKEHLYGLEAVKMQLDYINSNYPSVVNAAKVRMAIVICKWIPGLANGTREDKQMFNYLRAELMPYYDSIIDNSRVTKALKVRLRAIKMGFYPSMYIFKFMKILQIRKSKNRVKS